MSRKPLTLAQLRQKVRRQKDELEVALDYDRERYGVDDTTGLPVGWEKSRLGPMPSVELGGGWPLPKHEWVGFVLGETPYVRPADELLSSEWVTWRGDLFLSYGDFIRLQKEWRLNRMMVPEVSKAEALRQLPRIQGRPTIYRRNERRDMVQAIMAQPMVDWFDAQLQRAAVERVFEEMTARENSSR